jgi:hypothetical protein
MVACCQFAISATHSRAIACSLRSFSVRSVKGRGEIQNEQPRSQLGRQAAFCTTPRTGCRPPHLRLRRAWRYCYSRCKTAFRWRRKVERNGQPWRDNLALHGAAMVARGSERWAAVSSSDSEGRSTPFTRSNSCNWSPQRSVITASRSSVSGPQPLQLPTSPARNLVGSMTSCGTEAGLPQRNQTRVSIAVRAARCGRAAPGDFRRGGQHGAR